MSRANTDPRLEDLKAARILRTLSILIVLVVLVVLSAPLSGWTYAEPLRSYVRYGGVAVIVGLYVCRRVVMRRPLGPASVEASKR